MTIQEIPTELHLAILSFLSLSSLNSLSQSCKYFHSVCQPQMYTHIHITSYIQQVRFQSMLENFLNNPSSDFTSSQVNLDFKNSESNSLTKLRREDSGFFVLAPPSSHSGLNLIKSFSLNFTSNVHLSSETSSSVNHSLNDPDAYGSNWDHRFISPLLVSLSSLSLPNLSKISLGGAQFYDTVLSDFLLTHGSKLTSIDLSYSSVKDCGLLSLTNCSNLVKLDLSGLFRFRRISETVLPLLLNSCSKLNWMSIKNGSVSEETGLSLQRKNLIISS